ncbi:transposase domain-containing protein [Tropicibacter sp. S64]|uniref:transposase domain-containing protein n=1 Tax=Tropicibacter sp. S64 TaxID=3415122 RepID=UPI003C7A190F
MTHTSPGQHWWSAAELAEAGLPDMPTTKRKVNEKAKREGWDAISGKVRRRQGRGGGMEYHWTLLPMRARAALLQAVPVEEETRGRDEAWATFDGLKDSAKDKARDRLAALVEIEGLEGGGFTRSAAVEMVAASRSVSAKTLWNWFSLVDGVAPEDRLAYLAPRPGGGKGQRIEVDARFLDLVKGAYFQQSPTPMTAAYDWAVEASEAEGIPVPPIHQVRRIIDATVPKHVQVYLRKGPHALARYYPHQTRDKTYLRALEAVQADYHKFDVFIQLPGREKPGRIQMIAISDIYSGKFLSYRLSETANSHTVQLAFGDMVRRFGIPDHVLLDNGHEFVNKVMTGQVEYRHRFKIKDDDVLGLFPLLGTEVHFAKPGWGQAKPIERAFKDLCDRVAMHPAFVGAYTGRNTSSKPENYGSRSIPLDEFKVVLDREIAAHNARRGRRSEVANQRSFDEVFNASYAHGPVKKATEEQQRLWLLRGEGVRANRENGEIKIYGSRYWAEWMYQVAGQQVTVRFDPDDLAAGLLVYTMDGKFLGEAPVIRKGKFFGVADAKEHNRAKKAFERTTKEAARLERKLDAAEIAARLRAAGKAMPDDGLPEATVVRMPKVHPHAPKGGRRRVADPAADAALSASVAKFEARRKDKPEPRDPEADYARAKELQGMIAAGQALTGEQTEWLGQYVQSSEYRARERMYRSLKGKE